MPPAQPDIAFLSIVRWPRDYSREQMTEALVEATGIDPFLADQRVAKGVPAVVHRMDAGLARDILRHLHQRKVVALAPTRSQMEAIAPPLRAKRLAEAVGAPEPMYMCEFWRDEPPPRGLKVSDIFLIVRARLRRTERAEPKADVTYGYEPVTGYTTAEVDIVRKDNTRVTDLMDLYLRDGCGGGRIRISGDKFNFDVLGSERGHTDNENADKLALRLAEQSPRVLVDTGFGGFICPPDFVRRWRSSTDGRQTRDDHPAFDFYSVWAYLVYRRLAAREK